jgi:hypothetical protein
VFEDISFNNLLSRRREPGTKCIGSSHRVQVGVGVVIWWGVVFRLVFAGLWGMFLPLVYLFSLCACLCFVKFWFCLFRSCCYLLPIVYYLHALCWGVLVCFGFVWCV